MRIAIVENERKEIDGAFDYANFKFYSNKLEYEYFESSQSFLRSDWESFRLIFVDIHLSKKSALDGYSLIKVMLEKDTSYIDRIVIITGHHRVEDKLKEQQIPKLPIIYKPADFNEINKIFEMKKIQNLLL